MFVFHLAWRSAPTTSEEESGMHATTVTVDLAKPVFQVAVERASDAGTCDQSQKHEDQKQSARKLRAQEACLCALR